MPINVALKENGRASEEVENSLLSARDINCEQSAAIDERAGEVLRLRDQRRAKLAKIP